MLKKTVVTCLATAMMCAPAMAIELPKDVSPSIFSKQATAYPSFRFNDILEAYGLNLSPAGAKTVPQPYAKVKGDSVAFNSASMTYSPDRYHQIFTAYGLELSPEAVGKKLGIPSYATAKDGKISFGKDSIAYARSEWLQILGAYQLADAPMDSDGDGVIDAKDLCPNTPKGKKVNAQGCADSDGDGVIDKKDQCPGTPKGIVVDETGCWALSSELAFDVNSAVIKPEFYPALDGTKKVFDEYRGMKVQVEGHADSTGSDAYNMKLSQARAEAVVEYLVTKLGIADYRLKAVGFGETKPIASNDTPEGRSKNRRVVFTPMN